MKKYFISPILLKLIGVGLLLGAGQSQALVVEYSSTSLGGDRYRYDYSVTHDGSTGGADIESFLIQFESSLYEFSSLTIASDAGTSDWDQNIFAEISLGPDVIPPALDLFALTSGLGIGQSLSGFAIEFDWLGGAQGPGAQTFEVYDAFSFDLLEVGTTQMAVLATVAEPAGIGMGFLALMAFLWRRRF